MKRPRISPKNLRIPAEFSRFLLDELGWRRKEIRYFRSLVDKGTAQEALTRGAVAILYAHWEGFIRTASTAYLEHVRLQQRKLAELSSNFWALAANRLTTKAGESSRWTVQVELCDFIRRCEAGIAQWPKWWSVDAGSNLTVDVFHELIALLGIEYHVDFQTAEKPIIQRLVQLRNSIAHGEGQAVELSEYHQLHDKVDDLLQLFCNEVDNAAARELYLRKNGMAPALPN